VFCASMFVALKRGFRSMASLILVSNVVGELQPQEHLRHRAVSLRQHGFLVLRTNHCFEVIRGVVYRLTHSK